MKAILRGAGVGPASAAETAAPRARGSMESRSGKATAVPTPRRTVRREIRCVMAVSVGWALPTTISLARWWAQPTLLFAGCCSHLERIAVDRLDNQRREAVVVLFQGRQNLIDRTLIVILQAAAQSICEHFLR